MSLPVFQATVVNESGDIIPSATITVLDETTGLGLTVYSDRNGTVPLGTNGVFTAGTDGFAQFFAPAGNYRVKAEQASSGFERTWDFVAMVGSVAFTEAGTGADEIPTNENLSTSIAGTAAFSSDTYTFSPSGTGFRPLQAGMYLSFRLPSGSANTTATPDIDYDGSTYVIKWIDGSALVADDLEQTYNKQPILFYFDGTDMLIASSVSGSNSTGLWTKDPEGTQSCQFNIAVSLTTSSIGSINLDQSQLPWTFPKEFSSIPYASVSSEGSLVWGGVDDVTLTQLENPLFFSSSSLTGSSQVAYYVASGRWY